MRGKLKVVGAFLTVYLLGSSLSQAMVMLIELPASSDNTLYEQEVGGLSNGAGDYLFAGRTNQQGNTPRGRIRRSLLGFDGLSSIPSGAVIQSVEVSLFVSNISNVPGTPIDISMSLHRVSNSWGEGASDAPGQEGAGAISLMGDATWLHRFHSDTLWNLPGGDFLSTPSATTIVGEKGFAYQWSGQGLVDDVQFFIENPASDFGWILRADDESVPLSAKRFNSRDNPILSTRPMLAVTYVVPEVSTLLPLSFSFWMFWGYRRR